MSAQTSSQAPETDLPELSAALHQAAERALTLPLDPDHLVGRVRRKRRTRAVVAAGLVAALLALGGVAAPRLLSAEPDPANRTHKPELALADVTEARMISWFESMLPSGGRFGSVTGLGVGQKPPTGEPDLGQDQADASAIYNDGHSAGWIRLSVERWDANGVTKFPVGCPQPDRTGYTCTLTSEPGGGVLSVNDTVDQVPGDPAPMVDRSLCLGYHSGGMVCVSESNMIDLSALPTTGQVPLTLAQLRTVVMAPIWQQILGLIPKQPHLVPKTPSSEQILTRLLPHGYRATPVVRGTGAQMGVSSVLSDAQGKGLVYVTLMSIGNKPSDSLTQFQQTYPHGVRRPDGSWLGETQRVGEPEEGHGVVENEVAVMRGNFWVTVDALNTATLKGPGAGTAPVLTLDQLAAIAESPLWTAGTYM